MVKLFAMGNPLLDMQVRDGESVLSKYSLKANDAILVEDKQADIYDYIRKEFEIVYVAGGASQNAARAAQFCLPPNSAVYTGCVGSDDLAKQLSAANDKEGLKTVYQVLPEGQDPTGACAVIITGHNRSLVTKLAAAEKFTAAHLDTPEVKKLIEEAEFFYVEGFFLTHGLEACLKLAKYAADNNKKFALNLSAPFIPQFFTSQLDEVLPYVDVLFGNETEAEAYATAHGWETSPAESVPSKIAASPKHNSTPRVVVITQGASSTLLAQGGSEKTQTYPVEPLADDKIVDTNGAGDAFAGAFMAALISGRTPEQAVEAGHKLGRICVGQVGPTFGEKVQIL